MLTPVGSPTLPAVAFQRERSRPWRAAGSTVMCLAAVIALAACGGGSGTASTGTTGSAPSQTGAATSSTVASKAFTLEEGFEHDVCGIGVIVKFIAPTASSSKADEAVLIGGPVSNVQDTVQNHTGDQPLPANAAQLTAGGSVMVYGKSFKVDAVDTANSKVDLEARC